MYEVGEYIVHPGQGVCKVEGIAENPTAVYELMPIGQRHPMKISFPVASEAKLRPVLSREEAQELIDQYPTIPVEDFRDRSNALCRDTVRIVKTFRARIAQTKANNKKPPAAYERILKQASERSLSELAIALDTTPEDVMVLFQNSVEASQN